MKLMWQFRGCMLLRAVWNLSPCFFGRYKEKRRLRSDRVLLVTQNEFPGELDALLMIDRED